MAVGGTPGEVGGGGHPYPACARRGTGASAAGRLLRPRRRSGARPRAADGRMGGRSRGRSRGGRRRQRRDIRQAGRSRRGPLSALVRRLRRVPPGPHRVVRRRAATRHVRSRADRRPGRRRVCLRSGTGSVCRRHAGGRPARGGCRRTGLGERQPGRWLAFGRSLCPRAGGARPGRPPGAGSWRPVHRPVRDGRGGRARGRGGLRRYRTEPNAFCVTHDGGVVLVSTDGSRWEWPGGRPERGESWEDTLRREILEEACATITGARLLGFVRARCLSGHENGLVLVRSIWRAEVRLLAWQPAHEIGFRRVVPARDLPVHLWLGDGAGPIYSRAAREAALAQ
jgi:ADP-ribose pyrophosphatase YjhB (NUDIX family)